MFMPLKIFLFLDFLGVAIPTLLAVAFFTLLERKILSLMGYRFGPNKVSFLGILQPLGDAFKLSNKTLNLLVNFSFFFYYLSSFFMIVMMLMLFSCFFSFPHVISFKYGILIFFLILGFNSLNSILCGWCTFSKFSLIGSIRSVSQLISYEAVLYLCLFMMIISVNSFDLSMFYFNSFIYFGILLLPCLYIWIPTFLAELNRTPYDFSEGESELVSGFNTEFGSGSFTLIFLAEYGNIIFFCMLSSFLFFKSYFIFLLFFSYGVIWFRAVLPRFRFDKLMFLAWKFFIPFLTFFFLLFFLFLY